MRKLAYSLVPEAASARQKQILLLASRGMSRAQIGRELYVTEDTVKTHLYRLSLTYGTVNGRLTGVNALITEALKRGDLDYDPVARELCLAA